MPDAILIPAPGQIARVRQRLYLVEQTVPPARPRDSTLTLRSFLGQAAV